ncbi:MAG: ABC transporter ATP-binding protein [Thermaerobacter sp.]|nr:ABC transporter ATP-binding protein [Thermaerobacter sp.]
MTQSIMTATGLCRRFGGLVAVDGVDMAIAPGTLVGLLGPNGAGKTTTLRMLAGLMEPTSGSVAYGQYSMATHPLAAKQSLGYLADQPMMVPLLTGWEYILFVGGLYGLSAEVVSSRAEPLVRRFQLHDAIHRRCDGYSHGMQQKLALVAQLVHEPLLLLADEPTVGLDPASALALQEVFRTYCAQGHSILLSTHLLDMAQRLCGRVLIMHRGRIVWDGAPGDLLTDGEQTLEAVFLQLTEEGS